MYLSLVILWTISALNFCDGAKILGIFPTASFSHQQPLLAVTRALAEKGHELTVITTNPSKTPLKNHREIDISFLYQEWPELQQNRIFSLQERVNAFSHVGDFPLFIEYFSHKALGSNQLQDFIREVNGTTFDLIIYEGLSYSSYLGFSELVGNPAVLSIVTVHPFPISNAKVGNPELPSYIPTIFYPYGHKMSFLERLVNFSINIYCQYIKLRYLDPLHEELIQKYFGNARHTAYELEKNISMMIVSADLATGYPRPLHPNTINVGPMHLRKPDPLPQDLQTWMDQSQDGVIYFSLGSNMKGTSVPANKRAAFIRAFAQLPSYRVLWKWEADERLPGQPDNVLVRKWLPQQSILAHPKTKLFISQVGLQSFQEAISFGIPILGFPMFGDQDFNARKLVDSGAGRAMEFNDISYENVFQNLEQLLTNSSYKENMMKLSQITNDKPMPAIETAVWWIEYVLRHNGANHIKPASMDLAWYQYHCLDVIAAILGAILAVVLIVFYVLRKILTGLTNSKLKRH
ncbi:UDP-glycosyltransferase UGT5 isoform X2 [Nilaparvata lugens]|nr:UDP-glycosyltransferase UGT5 isoform X2 [Nilaparvata lugens]XP_039293138.1 UDP-glycosyltransferase UGT5 isoform X2 [Nilaparvata lugens]XP_039293139.1 UDP-glycosyltransferase UGT5 isoform X2 [Nilaparvata lugens]